MKKVIIGILKVFSFLPAIAMMLVIYGFSSQSGEMSGRISYQISYEIVEVKDIILDTGYSEEELAAQAHDIHYYVRKAAHMTEFFLLAVSVSFPLYVYGVRGIWLVLLAGVICVGYAGLDEYHQAGVMGRGPSIKDVGIDSVGVLLGVLIVQAFCWASTHNPSARSGR